MTLSDFNFVVPDSNIFSKIAVYIADTAVVNPHGIKTLSANDLSTFPIKRNLVLSNDLLKVYLKIVLIVIFYATEFLIILD